ncbi:hypothetical protein [Brevibacterium sp. UCMA 11754]|uniref:hypothetical protein n=2 Tax=unclassified Brevibacterium TaxID=2614124 RepID=UPI001F4870CF|nr:hypothetical protein [Brevibacterium sp. UCMA 11754]MCF2571659.1 hypothetical protein [Brevibacterium sp. UCMA 11754]
MMEPGLGAVIFLILAIIVVVSVGAFLVYRVMNRPDAHIGSRLPKDDPPAEAGPEDGRDSHRNP